MPRVGDFHKSNSCARHEFRDKKMKKLILIMLAVVSMALVSCGGDKKDKQETPKTAETVETPVAEPVVKEVPVVEEPSIHHFMGKVAGKDVHMTMLVNGSEITGKYYYDSYKAANSKAVLTFVGERNGSRVELVEFYKKKTGQFDGSWVNGVYRGSFTRTKDGKTFDFELTETEGGEGFFAKEELTFEVPDFEMDMDLDIGNLDIDFSDPGSADWDKILDEYEQYVNKYYSFAEKVSKGNASAMADALSMSEKAASLAEKLERAGDNLSMAQANRLLKIQNKMAQAAAKMAGAASKMENMMDDLEDMDVEDLLNNMPEIPGF